MAIWSSPKANDVDGNFVEGDWSNLVGFLHDAGLLAQPVPADRIYTTALLPEINKFDGAAVLEQAKTFNPDVFELAWPASLAGALGHARPRVISGSSTTSRTREIANCRTDIAATLGSV